jgi:hypothetical protein
MEALGRLFDVVPAIIPIDLAAGANTGLRIKLEGAQGIAFVYFADAGTAGEDVDLDIQQHTAATAGTTADLDVITRVYTKQEATLDNDEAWTLTTQAAASEVDLGAAEGEVQSMAVCEVNANSLTDGFGWVSVNIPDPGTTAGKIGCVIGILYDLAVQRKAENMAVRL